MRREAAHTPGWRGLAACLLAAVTVTLVAFMLPWPDAADAPGPVSYRVSLLSDGPLGDIHAVVTEHDRRIRLFDSNSLEPVAEIATGYGALVVARPSARQLIVSDALEPEGERILVLDAERRLELVATLPLTSRLSPTVYFPGMVLSRDERYLAVLLAYVRTPEERACTAGPCRAEFGVRLFDLAGMPIDHGTVDLPRGCGFPMVRAAGRGFVAACTDTGDVFLIEPPSPPGGPLIASTPLRIETAMWLGTMRRLQFATMDAAGTVWALRPDGVLIARRADGTSIDHRVLPQGTAPHYLGAFERDADRLVVPFRGSETDTRFAGYVVVRLPEARVEATVRVVADFLAPTAGDRVLTIRDGRLATRDLLTGTEVASQQLRDFQPSDVYLVPWR
jgi:hypothetical protein